ncbi:MAG: Flp pilus assembly complex ATPase component TadA [Sedimentisphaerales bacterium]|nr:Flp pilus assembly complex ATPase component TadA [Sedimentisphaerales bacterium]
MSTVIAAIQMGAYISIVKIVVFLISIFAWLPLITWINEDTEKVNTDIQKWTTIIFLAGVLGALIWLIMPIFIIGLPIYIIAVGTSAVLYIMHRNSIVDEYEKILTVNHIKSLMTNEEKLIEQASKGLVFVTANNNKVPAPLPKTAEFSGFKTSQDFFSDAIWRRVSDVALTPASQQYHVHFIIDGVMEKQEPLERDEAEHFIRYLKNLGDLDVEEKRKPQTGRFSVVKDGLSYVWEVTSAGTTAGEQIKLKRRTGQSLFKLPDLGLTASQLEQFQSLRDGPKGVFIVSGPKKNGVTSTLYALMQNNDPFLNNINILEKNPIAEMANITQVVYSLSDTGTTSYAEKFQFMLRTDPDIIGVEYCEKKEIARLACSAGRDKKPTYVTMESNSVNEAIGKWMQLIGDRNAAINYLVGVSNQRLIRKLCEHCREPYEPNKDMLKKFNIPAEKVKQFYRPGQVKHTKRGKPIRCEYCQGTGFLGREAIFESIILDNETRKLLKQAKSTADIANILRHARMLYLQDQAIRKVAAGQTSINEVVRALSGQQNAARRKTSEKAS